MEKIDSRIFQDRCYCGDDGYPISSFDTKKWVNKIDTYRGNIYVPFYIRLDRVTGIVSIDTDIVQLAIDELRKLL